VTLGQLLATGATDVPVWTLDENLRTVPGRMTHVFPSGTKPVFELRLASGRRVTASANHPFRTPGGWRCVADLAPGDVLATPRRLPSPLRPAALAHGEVVILAHLLGAGRMPACQAPSYSTDDPLHAQVVTRAAESFGLRVERSEHGSRRRLTFLSQRGRGRKRSDVVDWLVHLGIHGRRRSEVSVPRRIFSLPSDQLATFLRHLWSTGGGAWPDERRQRVRCQFTTQSRALAEDVQTLLLRFAVTSRVVEAASGRCSPSYHVSVNDLDAQLLFLSEIGVFGAGAPAAGASTERVAAALRGRHPSLMRAAGEPSPGEAVAPGWSASSPVPSAASMSTASVSSASVSSTSTSRGGLTLLVRPTPGDDPLPAGQEDVWWDPVVAVVATGEAPVFDATVPGTHNFLANGIAAHNSIEQDADVVLFLYRDELYNSESPDRGKAEVAIAKHRNGPTGVTELAFVDRYARFNNMARE
jgi:replicative DNA helicase